MSCDECGFDNCICDIIKKYDKKKTRKRKTKFKKARIRKYGKFRKGHRISR